jgi:putative tryptophan/tyrosine transport system substrate-binding protein
MNGHRSVLTASKFCESTGRSMLAPKAVAVFLLIAGLAVTVLAAGAQQAATSRRVGVLTVARDGDVQVQKNFEALRQGLRERGWIDRQNISFEYRWADGKYERLPQLAAELVTLKVDVILGATTPLIRAVKDTTKDIPIVMVGIIDPVGAGFVSSLARPGGNVTGLTYTAGPEIVGKQLELIKQVVPDLAHVAVLTNPANDAHGPLLKAAETAGRVLRVRVQPFGATDPRDLDSAFAAMTTERVRALLVLSDAGFYTHRGRIVELATKNRLPTIYSWMELVAAGGLLAYGPNITSQWHRAAMFVDKILKGSKPVDLPVEQPAIFELGINVKSARALALPIPPSLLLRADRVIE